MLGVFVISYNDIKLLPDMYTSFVNNMPTGMPYSMLGLDVGSNDGSFDYLQERMFTIHKNNRDTWDSIIIGFKDEDFKHLSRCLNFGFELLMKNKCTHILWLHPDVKSIQQGWTDVLMNYMNNNPKIAKLAPRIKGVDETAQDDIGNACPFIITADICQKLKDKYGYIYDPEYIGIGGYEDWDINKRIVDLGYDVYITNKAAVEHEGMGTRKNMDTVLEQKYNSNIYYKKYGTYKSFI